MGQSGSEKEDWVYSAPRDLSTDELGKLLASAWGFAATELTYLEVGFGSHHWAAGDAGGERRFVTVDDLRQERLGPDPESAYDALARAFETAAALREAGHGFVVAPLRDRGGAVVGRLDQTYAVSVQPHLALQGPGAFGAYESAETRREALRLVGELHCSDLTALTGVTRRDDFAVPDRQDLSAALDAVDRPWSGGPHSEPARQLLRADADDVRRLLSHYDALVDSVRANPAPWVVTHGEPHPGNVLRDQKGALCVVDWDTTLIAPRERDLTDLLTDDPADLAVYREAAGRVDIDPTAIRLYRVRWDLADIAAYVSELRAPHESTPDTDASLRYFQQYLPMASRWPDVIQAGSPTTPSTVE